MGTSAAPLLIGVAIICYLAAVVIALPLGITDIVNQNYSLVPLAAGGLAMALGMVAEARG